MDLKNPSIFCIFFRFNELNRRPRELNDLRLQWKRMKMKARKSLKTEANETGIHT